MANVKMDCRGMRSPLPISQLAARIKDFEPGQIIEIRADDENFGDDVKAFCRVSHHRLIDLIQEDSDFTAMIQIAKKAV